MSENSLEADGTIIITLPQGWVWTSIGEISLIKGGKRLPQGHSYSENPTQHPYIRVTDFKEMGINQGNLQFISSETYNQIKNYIISKNDLYISIAGTIGKVGMLPDSLDGANLTENAAKICPIQVDKKYYCYVLNSRYCQHQISRSTISTNQPKLALFRIEKISIPLPPLSEQHRIVIKIEELFTQLDAGVASLKKVQAQLKRYRQAVLKAAFEGRLTQEWREEHKGEIEPADVLLQNIREKPELTKYSIVDSKSLSILPEGWVWVKLGQLTDMSAGKAFLKSEYSENGVKLLQIANVSFGKIVWDVTTYLPQEYLIKYPELSLREGDMLIALNRPVLDGKLKIGILKERDSPSVLYQRVGRFDIYNPEIRDYIFYFAQSPSFINYFNKSLQGIEIPFINKPVLLNAHVAFPPIKEQQIIVSEIERIFSICDEIEATVTTSLRQAESLRQSILKRAFEGKLIPQDPKDEPASILLERIKAEKAHHMTETKKGKTLQPKSPKRKLQNGN